MKVYTRLTPRDWHEAKVKYSTTQAQRIILTKCWRLENALESGELCDREEVKRETAKEILQTLYKQTHNYYPSIDSYCLSRKVILVKDLENVCKQYGVDSEDEE